MNEGSSGEGELSTRIAELESRLAHAEATALALRQVGLALGSTVDLDELLELILRKITELLEADRATLYLLDDARGKLVSRVAIGDELRSIEVPSGKGIAGHVARSGKPLRIADAYRDKRFLREWDELTGYRTRSILAVPMKNHVGRTIGVIQVLNKRSVAAEFSQHDEDLLVVLSTQAAVSIDNSRLFLSVIQKNMQLVETKDQLERRVADLKLLFDLESAMSHAATLEELSWAVVRRAAEACDAEAGALLADEAEAGLFLYFVDARGDGADEAPPASQLDGGAASRVVRVAHKRREGLLGRVMATGEPAEVLPADEPAFAVTGAATGAVCAFSVRSAIAVPLEGEAGESLGALALFNSRGSAGFTRDDRSLLRLVSANAATALRLFRSRLESERSERLTAIGRLLSGVMHDMRTPLTVISGYVQLMADAADPKVRRQHLALVLKQFDLLSAMQREVLEFARGERSVLIRKLYLTKFFGDLEQELERELAGSGIELRFLLDDRSTARFDETKITRVMHNLTRNAIEAMAGRGGVLTIRVSRDGEDLVIEVSDTGPGISEAVRARLFQSFASAGKPQGTGLGLAIVKKIVDEHGGSILVSTSSAGTTFTVRLPQMQPGAAAGDVAGVSPGADRDREGWTQAPGAERASS